jgi:DNA repair protein RecO (recombination protein O)
MEWREDGIVVAVRRHGETSAIVEIFTRDKGRHLGLVRGGRSRRMRPVLQIGNTVLATWRARLSEHLGAFTLEASAFRAAAIMDDALALNGLTTLCALTRVLPERQPYDQLYDAFVLVLEKLGDLNLWPALAVRWELGLLEALGFGLDLAACAATGGQSDLIYVSPKSGRAVSAAAGKPYADRLLALPAFLSNDPAGAGAPDDREILDGFALTGFFLNRHVFEPRGIAMPASRQHLLDGWRASLKQAGPETDGV